MEMCEFELSASLVSYMDILILKCEPRQVLIIREF